MDSSLPPEKLKEFIYPTITSGEFCTVYFGAHILNWAYIPREDKVILEKFEEGGSYDPTTNTKTSSGKGERKTTKISTNTTTITALGYSERKVFSYSNAFTNSPYFVTRSYHQGADGFYVNAVSVSGIEENIYRYIKSVSYDTEREGGGEKRINQLFYNILGSNCASYNSPIPIPTPTPTKSKLYLGTAAPPPPPPKDMTCCDCNTIATIVENQSVQQIRAQEQLLEQLKDHIDKRVLEIIYKDLEHLKALNFEDFLKAIIKRLNEVESNIWNGINQ